MARIMRHVTVVRDGMHNAFTDLAYWQDSYWVSYRKADNHVSPDGEACVSVSVDRTRFREAARVKVPGDCRDPHLVVIDENRIALYFPAVRRRTGGETSRGQYVAFSEDGFVWGRPILTSIEEGKWLWRIRKYQDRFYGVPYYTTENNGSRIDFMVSDDLVNWELITQIGTDEHKMNETDLYFKPDGEVWLVARTGLEGTPSMLCTSHPPYTEWEVTNLNTKIHAPAILEHEGTLYVAGRCDVPDTFPYLSRSSLGLFRLERDRVESVMCLPATGDCSYPGLVKDADGRICMSYYSQHAYHMGIVPMMFRYEPEPPGHNRGQLLAPDDVYFVELELP